MDSARRLADYIHSLSELTLVGEPMVPYDHMGATLIDAVLQAGVRYDTVVRPRVGRLRDAFPAHATTTQFLELLRTMGPMDLLSWKPGTKKALTLEALAAFLAARGIETEGHLRDWLSETGHATLLRGIKGVGPKTVDYLKLLVGLPAVAVDVHLLRFLQEAGIQVSGYDAARQILVDASKVLGITEEILDYSLWNYMSKRP